MTKQEIIDLLIESEVGQAIKAMRAASPNDNTILNLAGQWNRLQKDITANLVSKDYSTLTQNQIMNSLLELAKKMPDDSANAGGGSGSPTIKSRSVFLSYNHKDTAVAAKIKSYLEGQNIKVTIDSEAMRPGEDIASFIYKCIKESAVTLSLVSTNSLLSAWVGLETMNTLSGEKISDKEFIAVVTDGAFYGMSFVRESIKVIDKRIQDIDQEIIQRIQERIGFDDLYSEKSRNEDLRTDLPKIVANLKNRLNVDITAENFNPGMDRVSRAILNK